jgi:toxin HigB-1
VIRSFRCEDTGKLASGVRVRRFVNIERAAQRKLAMLDAATTLDDVRIPPANRLEKLSGARAGQYSIRINDQWRLCFEWRDGDACGVEIVDYHR